MTLKLAAGYDTDYLLSEVGPGLDAAGNPAVAEYLADHQSASSYYTGAVDEGEPPGIWFGAGAESLGLGGVVDATIFQGLFEYKLDPRDPAAADISRWGEARTLVPQPNRAGKVEDAYTALLEQHPHAGPEERAALRKEALCAARPGGVPFDDLTFSPPKSVSVMWAACEKQAADARVAGEASRVVGEHSRAGSHDLRAREWAGRATKIEQAVLNGHRAALAYIQDTACFVRTGHHGNDKITGQATGKWLKATGLIAASFLQHDSRDRDPQLHVHGPIQNLAQGEDGKWRGLDRARLQAAVPGASAIAHRTMEAELAEELGFEFRTRPDGKAREIVGVDEESRDAFSSRRRAITPATEKLIDRFRDEVGREPTAKERSALAQQATLSTRAGKHHGDESPTETLDRWADKHRAEVGADLGRVADRVFTRAAPAAETWSEHDVIARALATVSSERQSWTREHLLQHLSDALPGNLGVPGAEVRPLLDGLADRALGEAVRLSPETHDSDLPAALRRADGASVYANPRPVQYATRESLAGEAALREAAVTRGAPVLSARAVEAVLAEYAAAQRPLGADQAAAVRGIATSGAMVDVLAAPAGTGKTFAIGSLAKVWEEQGAGRVRGIAFGQLQADELSAEGVTSRNIAHWLVTQQRLAAGRPLEGDEEFRLRKGDLLVVDEAQLAGTPNLVRIHQLASAAGAKLLPTGDPGQGGMGPSGALRDLVGRATTHELTEVRRFDADWEGPASLRLRDGDTRAVTDYATRGRLVDAGAIEQAEAGAARAWLADTLTGKESLVVCSSNEGAGRVCAALRAELVALGKVEEAGVALKMQGTFAGVGDLIQARHADRTLGLVNRSRFRVQEVLSDGSLRGAPVSYGPGGEQLGEARTIPANYVREHVALGYASTGAAAIGRTVDSCYGVVTQGMSRATAYVIATRGRAMNRLYLVTQGAPTDAVPGETAEAPRRDAAAMLTDLIGRPVDTGAELTATAQAELAERAAESTHAAVDPLVTTLSDLTDARTAQLADQLAVTGELPEKHRIALANDPATRAVTQLLRTAELAGHDPAMLLGNALGGKSLDGSVSVAQVLHGRIRGDLGPVLPPRIESYRDLIPTEVPAGYRVVLQRWADAADDRRRALGAQATADPPAWARSLGPVPTDLLGRADWEQKAGWAASYREWAASAGGPLDENDPLGAAPPAGLAERHAIWQTAHHKLGLIDGAAAEEEMTEGQLRVRVAAYEREKNWAPRYVADELQATYDALNRTQADTVIWAARADTTTDPDERAALTAAAEQARAEVERYSRQIPQLEEADQARGAWYTHTAGTREAATRGHAAMKIRGIDPDATDDHVTAKEWLDTHRAEQAETDQHREIRDEHDLLDTTDPPTGHAPEAGRTDAEATVADGADDLADQQETGAAGEEPIGDAERVDEPQLETGMPDLRATSKVDEKESADSAAPRRVPFVDETTAEVERAQTAVAEIEARTTWDATQEATEMSGSREPDESARAAELNRYADDDRAAEEDAAASSATAGAAAGD